jgi:hypothetical protein
LIAGSRTKNQGWGSERHCFKEQQHNPKLEIFLGGLFQGTASESVVVSRNNNNQTNQVVMAPTTINNNAGNASNNNNSKKEW